MICNLFRPPLTPPNLGGEEVTNGAICDSRVFFFLLKEGKKLPTEQSVIAEYLFPLLS